MQAHFRLFAGVFAAALLLGGLPSHAQLVVNEIDYDQPGSDFAEFLEIKNVSAGSVDLSLYDVVLINGSNGSVYQTVNLPSFSLSAGGYYVLCEDAGTVANCNLDILNSIQNGGPDAVAIQQGATIIDTVSYEGNTIAPYTETSGVGLVDIGGSGFEFAGIARFPDGDDTDVNNVDLSVRCITPGAANEADNSNCPDPPVFALAINEIDYDQPGVDDAEFIEILVTGNQGVNLSGFTLELIDGATGNAYGSVALTAGILNAGDYWVVCNNLANTPNCDQVAGTATEWLQNGAPDAIALTFSGQVRDTVSYEGNSPAPYTEGSGVGVLDSDADADAGIARFPNGSDSDVNNVDFAARCITPGVANTSVTPPCGGGASVEIFAIQGSGLASPLQGQVVTSNDNVVTAVAADGFFMQTPAARSDGDDLTSDGIFVFTNTQPLLSVGDQVDVIGTVDEFFNFTEITNSPFFSVDSSGNALPAPVQFDANTPSPNQPQPDTEIERYEGMRVSATGVATGGTDQFGDTPVVATTNRPFREPGIAFPGLTGLPVWDGNPEVFELDTDGAGLPEVPMFGGQGYSATGPLGFSFGDYQILPTSLTVDPAPALPRAVRAKNAGEFTIAAQNVLRLFDTVDDPLTQDTITSAADFAARVEKISYHARITLGAPDIIALQEVENLTVVQALATQINLDDPSLTYSAHLLEGNDVGGIDNGYLTRDDTIVVNGVTQHGANEILAFDGSLLNDRPPLVLDADYLTGGTPFPITVINVHQRSLGGIEGSDEVRVRTKRDAQAVSLATFIQGLQTADPGIHLAATGDYNGFEFTDGYVDIMGQVTGIADPLGAQFPVTPIVSPPLTNQVLSLPLAERYSFIFGGTAQVLDTTVTSSALDPMVSEFAFARGNSDASGAFFLQTGANIGLRIADHDGHVLFVTTGLDSDGDGVADDMDNCSAVANPSQHDSNGDGYGNICDADLNNDGIVNPIDLGIFRAAFFATAQSANWNPDADFDNNGVINPPDLGIIRLMFFGPPGPSGLVP